MRGIRASYRAAVKWIAANDDTEWLHDENGIDSVTVALVADIFGKPMSDVAADVRRAVARLEAAR